MPKQAHLKVSTWKVKTIGSTAIILFSWFAVLALMSKQNGAFIGFILFILSALPTFLFAGPISITDGKLGITTTFGRFELPLQEILSIEQGTAYWVFFGTKGRLSIPASFMWTGSDKAAFLSALDSVIQERNIEIKSTIRADYLLSKNTKIA
jgi:hypothetical protein